MNRNTVLAFLLIIITISFFNSSFYYEKILRRPHPSTIARTEQEKAGKQKESKEFNDAEKTQNIQREATPSLEKQDDNTGISPEFKTNTNDSAQDRTGDTIWVETEKLIVGISEIGAKIISVKTKEYRLDPVAKEKSLEENPYIELVDSDTLGGANLSVNNQAYDTVLFKNTGDKKQYLISGNDSLSVGFLFNNPSGEIIEKKFSFTADGYIIGIDITSPTLDGKKISIGWLAGIAESENQQSSMSGGQIVRKLHFFDGKNVEHKEEKKPTKEQQSGYYKWVAMTSKYFLIAIINDSTYDTDINYQAFEEKKNDEGEKEKKQPTVINYRINMQHSASGSTESYKFYIGPSQFNNLTTLNLKLEKVLFSGWRFFFWADVWFPLLCEFVLWLLIILQKSVKDYGVVIIILTILSKVITYPLTQSSMKSMNKMRDMQPKISEIREKYKSDPKKMNQKMMEFYKKEGINPLNPGCLPMFLQMPILFALFIVLQKAIELRGQGTWLVPWIHDLSKPEILPIPFINPLPFEIPFYGSNVALIPIIMAVLTYFQNKATIKDPNQKFMIWFMPIFMLALFNNFPSGLVIYWTFSSALALVQQFWTDWKKRTVTTPTKSLAKKGTQK